jgi:predicted SnoaL-like aldol condensation-catalyzing enzyme
LKTQVYTPNSSRARLEARGDAIVDVFRLENRKIVEHRDVIQPALETAANPNTMF